MKASVGADDITVNSESEKCFSMLKTYSDQGFITNIGIARAVQIGNALYIDPKYTPIGSVDFVGGTITVVIPN